MITSSFLSIPKFTGEYFILGRAYPEWVALESQLDNFITLVDTFASELPRTRGPLATYSLATSASPGDVEGLSFIQITSNDLVKIEFLLDFSLLKSEMLRVNLTALLNVIPGSEINTLIAVYIDIYSTIIPAIEGVSFSKSDEASEIISVSGNPFLNPNMVVPVQIYMASFSSGHGSPSTLQARNIVLSFIDAA